MVRLVDEDEVDCTTKRNEEEATDMAVNSGKMGRE